MVVAVRVQPKSSQKKLERIDEKNFKAYLNAPPENNKANVELVALLANELKVKKYQIVIIKGLTSQHKVVRIDIDS